MRKFDPAVYVIRCLETKKVYVGSSVKVKERLASHKRHLLQNRHGNGYLQRAWNKYGAEGFSFDLHERCKIENRLEREQFWIDEFKADDEEFGFNLIPTRKSQLYGSKIAKYQRAGWAKLTPTERKKKNSHLFTKEMRDQVGKLSGLSRSTEKHIERQRKIAQKYLCTDENKEKNSERQFRRWQDPVYRAKMLAALKVGRDKTNARRRKPAPSNEIV